MKQSVHLPLFLLAFAIALVIKLWVDEKERPGYREIEAQLTYNPPSSDVLLYDLEQSVRVGVRGQASEMIQLSPFTVEVAVDVPAGRPGATEITLSAENVRFNVLGDFEVVSLEPNSFTIQREPAATETVPVRAELGGEPAAGAQPGEIVVRPSWVEISGPESEVRRVSHVTAPVSLDGHARTFEDAVAVTPPHPQIQIQPRRVIVEVTMQEPELSISVGELQDDSIRQVPESSTPSPS